MRNNQPVNWVHEATKLRTERDRWRNEAEYWHAMADRCDSGCKCLSEANDD